MWTFEKKRKLTGIPNIPIGFKIFPSQGWIQRNFARVAWNMYYMWLKYIKCRKYTRFI